MFKFSFSYSWMAGLRPISTLLMYSHSITPSLVSNILRSNKLLYDMLRYRKRAYSWLNTRTFDILQEYLQKIID